MRKAQVKRAKIDGSMVIDEKRKCKASKGEKKEKREK